MDTRLVKLEPTENGDAVRYGKCVIGTVKPDLIRSNIFHAYLPSGRLVLTRESEWAAAYALATWSGY